MICNDKVLVILLTAAVITIRTCTYTTAPLWQDSLRVNIDHHDNFTHNTSEVPWSDFPINASALEREVDPYFCAFSHGLFTTVFYGTGYVVVLLFFPHKITEQERSYPQHHLVATGIAQAVCTVIINFCMSGTRTAPYLLALLSNFQIPIQFITRLIILRRRPTLRKCICAIGVIISGLISLIPNIFPSLEPASEHRKDGGASGVAGVLWPIGFVFALVPNTLVNVFMERSVKTKKDTSQNDASPEGQNSQRHINMLYYQFWYGFWTLLTTTALFWLALVPGIGSVPNIEMFFKRMGFNFACIFGAAGCGPRTYILGWVTIILRGLCVMTIAFMLRYSEGANYFTVAMTLRSPISLLFWTLFHENPFYWNPHTNLSTYLAILALCVMVPAVHIYNTGAPEKVVTRIIPKLDSKSDEEKLLDEDQDREDDVRVN